MALRQLRTEAGLSLRALGQAAHYDFSRISRVERGEHLIDTQYVPALDQALGTGGLLGLLRSLPPTTTPAPDPARRRERMTLPTGGLRVDDGDSVTLQLRTPDGRTVQVSLSRRDLGKLLAGGSAARDPAGRRGRPRRRPSGCPRCSAPRGGSTRRSSTTSAPCSQQHFTADKMLGPRATPPPGPRPDPRAGRAAPPHPAGHCRAHACGSSPSTPSSPAGSTRTPAIPPRRCAWSDRASQWAQAVGDYQMVAYMLIRKSNIACSTTTRSTSSTWPPPPASVPGALSPKLRRPGRPAGGPRLGAEPRRRPLPDRPRHSPPNCCATTPTT